MTDPNGGSWGAPTPQGPGWWQASDGLWYPPQDPQPAAPPAPGYAPTAAYPSPAPAGYGYGYGAPAPSGGFEVSYNGPLEVARWRPLLNWVIGIPHLVVLWLYGIGAAIFGFIAFFQVLFTGKVSRSNHEFLVKYQRYSWRVMSFVTFLRNDSPKPFGLVGTDLDPGDDPARLSIPYVGELNRWAVLYKWILAIPAFVVLYLFLIAAQVLVLISFFQVLFTGRWSAGSRDFYVKVHRQSTRIFAYCLLTDEKPPISPE